MKIYFKKLWSCFKSASLYLRQLGNFRVGIFVFFQHWTYIISFVKDVNTKVNDSVLFRAFLAIDSIRVVFFVKKMKSISCCICSWSYYKIERILFFKKRRYNQISSVFLSSCIIICDFVLIIRNLQVGNFLMLINFQLRDTFFSLCERECHSNGFFYWHVPNLIISV